MRVLRGVGEGTRSERTSDRRSASLTFDLTERLDRHCIYVCCTSHLSSEINRKFAFLELRRIPVDTVRRGTRVGGGI